MEAEKKNGVKEGEEENTVELTVRKQKMKKE